MAELRKQVFNLLAVSDYRHTPPSLLESVGSKFVWYREIRIEVNLPREEQLISAHPALVKRLIAEFPQLSASNAGITCGLNRDFVKELEEDTAGSLGHLWEHIAAQAFDDVSSQLGYGDHEFVWQSKPIVKISTYARTVYNIFCLHEQKPPPEFWGLENVVTGYLNAFWRRGRFPLRERLRNFIEHRAKQERRGIISFCFKKAS